MADLTHADIEYLGKFTNEIRPDEARDWIKERMANCLRIAKMKEGTDRRGWLEDAAFFAVVISMLDTIQSH